MNDSITITYAIPKERRGLARSERTLRHLLFMSHRHNDSSACLYGDDGEMQCGACHCDFVRDSPDELQRKIDRWNMQECIRLGLVTVAPNADVTVGPQPRITVKLTSFPESNGKQNWTAMLVRVEKFDKLVGNCHGITIDRGEYWNRVAYHAECARLLIGERDTEPNILDYGDDIKTPDQWAGEVRGGR